MLEFCRDYGYGTKYIESQTAFCPRPWFANSKKNRKDICLLNRLKSNRNLSKFQLCRKNILRDDMCDCLESPQTLEHLFWRCPKLAERRQTFLNLIRDLQISVDTDICLLMNSASIETCWKFVKFAIDADMKV
ncbi:hypothetical protein QAD02_015003 [Eretmocerus hayati]|uniref:Uncharacterized protein n=1 Tax=Eretmocerus hayati TaxID=131215 RepID=A0ACC2P8B2_9HYME|nr:hypothetical protein QAD02_015003 [Eretmocerus hayati]